MSKPEDFKFDSRVRDRLLRNRVLSTADVQRHLEQLPDLEGEYEVLSDTPQPAVAPPRSEVTEEPLVFDGIRRLQALGEVSAPAPARYAPPAPAPVSNSGVPPYREPESRGLGTPLRSALMESEISGVGAGAVSAALGAMAAEARGAAMFGAPPVTIPQPIAPSVSPAVSPPVVSPAVSSPAVSPAVSSPAVSYPAVPSEPPPATPVTLRSEASPPPAPALADDDDEAVGTSNAVADEDEDEETEASEDEDDVDDEDSDDEDSDEDDDDDTVDAAGSEPDNEELA